MEGTPWYLFVKADIHDSRIWAKAPTNRLEKCIKGICYNNIKLTVAPNIHVSDVEEDKTHDARLEASSDSNICWLAGFWGFMPRFSSSTPVSTQSRAKKTDVTQFFVDYYTHRELEVIMINEFGLGDKNMSKRGQRTAKISENGSQIEYAPIWNQSWPKIFFIYILRLTLYTGARRGRKTKAF